MRQAFWERFGLRLEDLGSWPSAQIQDYIDIMSAEAHVQNEGSNGGGSQTAQKTDTTEKAYQAMRAAAQQREAEGG